MVRLKLPEDANRQRNLALLVMLVAALHGVAYALLVPLWQAPDEPGHFETIRILASERRLLQRSDKSSEIQREIIASLSEHDFWHWVGRATPQPLPETFSDDSFLARSGQQTGDEPLLYYVIPALICRWVTRIDAQVRLVRLYSVLLSTLAAGVGTLAAQALFPGRRRLAAAISAFQALLPMAAFIGASVNNDAMALLLGNVFFWVLVRTTRRGLTVSRVAVLVLLPCLGLAGKKTTLFLAPLALVAVLWLMVEDRREQLGRVVKAMAAAAALALVVLWLGRGTAPANWTWGQGYVTEGRSDIAAREGEHTLRVGDEATPYLVQRISEREARRRAGQRLVLSAWVRSDEADAWARLTVHVGDIVERHPFKVGAEWARQEVTIQLPEDPHDLRIAVAAGRLDIEDGQIPTVLFDDVRLVANDGSDLLRNGGAEIGARWLQTAPRQLVQQSLQWAKLIRPGRPYSAATRTVASRLLNRKSYDSASLRRYGRFVLLTIASFWGNFGWLTLPLPLGVYAALALACLWGMVGVVLHFRRLRRGSISSPAWQRRALLLLGLGLLLVAAQTFLPMIGRSWQPQGRYLFAAIFPIAVAFCFGLQVWVPPGHRAILWGCYQGALVALAVYCLLWRVVGFYWWGL